ncbi:MAG: hypothetical protein [Caudoviricetes sp.]|nr:MAG: hypothetical protein [Caudoviricetes sp.]
MSEFKAGYSPLSGKIYVGNVSAKGVFAAGKKDITDTALAAVAEKLKADDRILSWELPDGKLLQLRADVVEKPKK